MSATVKPVSDAPDPKTGKARAKSGVAFPYFDLESCVDVAKAVHDRAGGSCDLAQLATLLDYSGVRNGAFRMRISASRMFGLIEDTGGGRVRVTARGLSIVAPVSQEAATKAKVDAFLAVELFRRVYEQYHGSTLPEEVGLRNLLQTEYHVVPDRVVPTVRIMLKSAEYAGLFTAAGNRTRMVMPLGVGLTTPQATPQQHPSPPTTHRETHVSGGGDGGGKGGGNGSEIDPAILGLLRRLPPVGSTLGARRRQALIDAFTSMINFIYPDNEEA